MKVKIVISLFIVSSFAQAAQVNRLAKALELTRELIQHAPGQHQRPKQRAKAIAVNHPLNGVQGQQLCTPAQRMLLELYKRTQSPSLLQRCQNRNIRPCPKCGTLLERTEGCDYLTCPCKHEFCLNCYGKDHVSNCKNPRFNPFDLRAMTMMRYQIEGRPAPRNIDQFLEVLKYVADLEVAVEKQELRNLRVDDDLKRLLQDARAQLAMLENA
jgi:hypothetical protein